MTAAAVLNGKIMKRLKGDCRLDIQTGDLFSMSAESHKSCSTCSAPCTEGKHASAQSGTALHIYSEVISENTVQLHWSCPSCGRDTVENSAVLNVEKIAAQIESDPLCFKCRSAKPSTLKGPK